MKTTIFSYDADSSFTYFLFGPDHALKISRLSCVDKSSTFSSFFLNLLSAFISKGTITGFSA